jgi:hypothetical protein
LINDFNHYYSLEESQMQIWQLVVSIFGIIVAALGLGFAVYRYRKTKGYPDIVPVVLQMSRQPVIIDMQNEGSKPARAVKLSLHYKEYSFYGEITSIAPGPTVSVELETVTSPYASNNNMPDKTLLRCEFEDEQGKSYTSQWESNDGVKLWKKTLCTIRRAA